MWKQIFQPTLFGTARAWTCVRNRCWRRKVLVRIIRCWWRFRSFWSPKSSIFSHQRRASTVKRCHQHLYSCQHTQIFTNFKSPTSRCRRHHCRRKNASFLIFYTAQIKNWFLFHINAEFDFQSNTWNYPKNMVPAWDWQLDYPYVPNNVIIARDSLKWPE